MSYFIISGVSRLVSEIPEKDVLIFFQIQVVHADTTAYCSHGVRFLTKRFSVYFMPFRLSAWSHVVN
jgi:hypothetical protein